MQQQLFELEQKRRDALSQLKHVQDTAAFHPKEEIKSGLVRIEASKQRLEEIDEKIQRTRTTVDMAMHERQSPVHAHHRARAGSGSSTQGYNKIQEQYWS